MLNGIPESSRTGSRVGEAVGEKFADGSPDETLLSVVIPTLNEADRIEVCLDSVFRVCRDVSEFEVIVVDSNSDDRTVEIARQYPVSIFQIPDDGLATPSAGRYIGTKAASGDQILFVDGDMNLTDGWLGEARRLLTDREDVMGVDGHLNDGSGNSPELVKAIHGTMLYDADRLHEVGGFDPFLQGYEDIEVSFRLRAAGYELLRLPTVVATHSKGSGVTELKRRWQNGYLFGFGQAVRKSIHSPYVLGSLLRRRADQVLFLTWFLLGALVLLSAPDMMMLWIGGSAVLFTVDAVWEGPAAAMTRSVWYGTAWIGFLRGFLRGTRPSGEYPLDSIELLHEPSQTRSKRSQR
jgi:glycosyltransferase involved in cell wall biosynthesis